MSGVSLGAYWFGNFSLDYVKYLFFGVGAPILIWILQVEILMKDGLYFFLWVICLMVGLAMIPYAYFWSFAFKKTSSMQVTLFLVTFISGFILPILTFILSLFAEKDSTLELWNDRIVLFSRIFLPSFCFGDSLYKMGFR